MRVKRSQGFPQNYIFTEGEEIYLKTSPGDIVIFDVRLTHRGQYMAIPHTQWQKPFNFLKRGLHKTVGVAPSATERACKNIYDRLAGDRLSIFFTYGAHNDYTRQFSINNMKRQLLQLPSANVFLSPSLRQSLADNNVHTLEDEFARLIQTDFSKDLTYIPG